MVFIENPQSEN